MKDKLQKLEELRNRAQADLSLPLREGATQLVFGDGNPDSDLFFLGEAPGFNEDQKGIPFIGRAGKLLDQTLEEIGVPRPTIWISNVVYFRPPANRDPEPGELAAFQPYINEQITIFDPKVIVTLGRFSMGKFIPGAKISQVHGQPRWIMFADKKRVLIPMYHPAAALRSTNLLTAFKSDFLNIPKVLKKLEKLNDKTADQKQDQIPLF